MKKMVWSIPLPVKISLLLLAVLSAAVILAPLIAGYDPVSVDLAAVGRFPGGAHCLGTDNLGRDVLSRLLYGGRVSLLVGFVSVAIATTLGVVYGAASGYLGGKADVLLMRVLDAMLSLPSMLLMLVIQAIAGAGLTNLMLVIGFTSWMQTARMVRAEVISLKQRDFVKAARIIGVPWWRIIARHMVPHCAPIVVVVSTLGVGHAIMSEASLSFLGLGIPPHEPSWGNMLMGGQNSILAGAWWITFFPGLAIVTTVISLTYIGDYLQNLWNPRQNRAFSEGRDSDAAMSGELISAHRLKG